MKAHYIILSTILILLCTTSYGQYSTKNVYYVSKGDTITGHGVIHYDLIYFRDSPKSKTKIIYPNEIDKAANFIDNRLFRSFEIVHNYKKKWVFLEYLVDGEIDLFYLVGSGRYFMKKEGTELLELEHKKYDPFYVEGREFARRDTRYIGLMKYYMKEAPELFKRIEKVDKLNHVKLVELSVDYHNVVCDDYECTTYLKEIP